MEKSQVMLESRGVTLIELIVVVFIISVLLLVGTPIMTKWLANYRVKNFAYGFASGFSYARDVSRRDGERVVVAVINSNSSPQNWTGSSDIGPICYLIFEDKNKDMQYQAGERIVGYGKCKGISVVKNNIGKACMGGSGRCLVLFPVGFPLIGATKNEVMFESVNYPQIKYSVILGASTGSAGVVR